MMHGAQAAKTRLDLPLRGRKRKTEEGIECRRTSHYMESLVDGIEKVGDNHEGVYSSSMQDIAS